MKTSRALIVCALLRISTAFASANLITNGDFQTGDLTGWTVTHAPGGSNINVGNAIEFHGNSPGALFGADVGFDSISQTFSTTPGSFYTVSYYYQPGFTAPTPPDNEFQVLFNGNVIFHDLNALAGVNMLHFEVLATGTTTTLEFQGRDTPYFLYLDDVSVTPVPDFGSSALLLSVGLLGLFAVQRGLLTRHA